MTSRAEYLSKYLGSGGSNADHKKKKKKKTRPEAVVVVEQPGFTNINTQDKDKTFEEEDLLGELDDDDMFAENEARPVKVDFKANKVFKGFKRIDNGQEVQQTNTTEVARTPEIPEQTTVYRDSTGRIVDIEEVRKQKEEEKEQKEASRQVQEVRLTEEEQIRQTQQSFKSKIDTDSVEDPLGVFDPEKVSSNSMLDSDEYTYRKGVNPTNRFGIKAGVLWDGIDRSNGFEDLMMRKINDSRFKKIDSGINESYEVDID